jgi:hypothetical protein
VGRFHAAEPRTPGLIAALVRTVVAPGPLFAALAVRPRPALGMGAILLLAALWSLLSLRMAAGGHAPAVGVPGLAAAHHYVVQAAVLPLVLLLAWRASAAVAGRVAVLLGGMPAPAALRTTLGFASAVPLAAALVLPDLVVLETFGHAALARAMRWYAPVAVVWAGVLAVCAVHASTDVAGWRAVAAALAGLVAAVLLLALVVR